MQFSDFFNFRGRLNRKAFWIMYLIMLAVVLVCGAISLAIGSAIPTLGLIVFAVPLVAFIIASIAISLRRIHDRNKSGWWLFGYYAIPSILSGMGEAAGGAGILFEIIGGLISIVGFVEIGCLKGTEGPNQYGADPLGISADPAVFE